MNSVPKVTFDEWFAKERKDGLLDFKLAVTRNRGISAQALTDDILNIETLIASGRVTELPEPVTFVPAKIEQVIRSVKI